MLASQGIESVSVGTRARVAIVTTGDELAEPRKQPRVGEIFDSNGVMLDALAARTGAQVTMQRHCPDNFDTLCTTLRDAVQHDALIISGGVSVGEHDLVREALREIGAEIDLWRVAVKPGKPFLFGKRDRCLIFGLPGNPVSAFVTFLTIRAPRVVTDDGGDERCSHFASGKRLSDPRSYGRRNAASLFSRRIERHALYRDWTSGIACPFWTCSGQRLAPSSAGREPKRWQRSRSLVNPLNYDAGR